MALISMQLYIIWVGLINGGESVDFITRRLVIFASEDIGNANPNAFKSCCKYYDSL